MRAWQSLMPRESRLLRRFAPPKKIDRLHGVGVEIAAVAYGSFAMTVMLDSKFQMILSRVPDCLD